MKPKPKFRVGQMVVIRGPDSKTDYGRKVFRRWYRASANSDWRYTVAGGHADDGWRERELRPLTPREIGPRGRK